MVEILISTYYKRLICLKYTGKILGLFGQLLRSYKHCKVVTLIRLSQYLIIITMP